MLSFAWILATGIAFGLGAVMLVAAGNPGNYGFCAACQLRDIAGAIGLHSAAMLQYARPEILGWVLGAFAISTASGQFRPRGGSNPAIRFLLGMAMMIGALVFLGCPLRGILRLAGGDLNGITGLAGFASGIGVGILFLKNGFNLGRASVYRGNFKMVGYFPAVLALILMVGVFTTAPWLNFSAKGPGSQHAPLMISLCAGLVTGALAWKTRMCLSGGIRDYVLVRDTFLLKIYGVMFLAALVANLYFGLFKLGFEGQPLAHTMHLWNFLGLFVTGMAATLAGGCPLRQLIMSAEGNMDALACVLGMLVGAGVSHTLNLAGSAAGVAMNGQIGVVAAGVVVMIVGRFYREQLPMAAKG